MKKNILIAITTFVVIASLIGLLSFALSSDISASSQPAIVLNGTWKVVSSVSETSVTMPEAEYIRFTENTASLYRNDVQTPYVSSAYSIDAETLTLPQLSSSYKLRQVTENIVSMAKNKNNVMYLVRWNDEMQETAFDISAANGTWKVLSHACNTLIDEIIVFNYGILNDYRNGSASPFITSSFTIKENNLTVNSAGLNVLCYQPSDDTLIFVQTSDGLVWELLKSE